jgi:hypothetical protein
LGTKVNEDVQGICSRSSQPQQCQYLRQQSFFQLHHNKWITQFTIPEDHLNYSRVSLSQESLAKEKRLYRKSENQLPGTELLKDCCVELYYLGDMPAN